MPAGRPSSSPRLRRSDTGRPVLSARAGAALGVLVVLVAILAIPFKEWITQRSRIADLEAQTAWHTARVAELERAHARWKDPAYVESQARARLHYVRPGEVGYVVLTEEETAPATAASPRPMARAPQGVPWWGAVWSTVEQVDTPGASAPPQAPPEAQPAPSYGR